MIVTTIRAHPPRCNECGCKTEAPYMSVYDVYTNERLRMCSKHCFKFYHARVAQRQEQARQYKLAMNQKILLSTRDPNEY